MKLQDRVKYNYQELVRQVKTLKGVPVMAGEPFNEKKPDQLIKQLSQVLAAITLVERTAHRAQIQFLQSAFRRISSQTVTVMTVTVPGGQKDKIMPLVSHLENPKTLKAAFQKLSNLKLIQSQQKAVAYPMKPKGTDPTIHRVIVVEAGEDEIVRFVIENSKHDALLNQYQLAETELDAKVLVISSLIQFDLFNEELRELATQTAKKITPAKQAPAKTRVKAAAKARAKERTKQPV